MGFLKDFKAFAMKGNVMDLAVGVIIGAAFGKIVSAVVDDILMPIIGIFGKGSKFDDKFVNLSSDVQYKTLADAKAAGANVFAYGHFIQTIVDFLIVAFCIFLIIRAMTKLERKKEEAPAPPPGPSSTDMLLMEIRDALKK
ncbi:MAG: large conductance mechanosensitive channel protein MscL [Bacteroidetes bacterium]|nr:large conductance mechanosensitive channel protein MscL [Bacteroidota bacterium]